MTSQAPTARADEGQRRLRLLFDLGCAFAARTELDELISLVVERCREAFDAEGASVLLHDPASDELYVPYVVGRTRDVAIEMSRQRFSASLGVAGFVLRNGQAVRIDDAKADPRVYREVDRRTGVTTRNMLCAPLRSRDATIGVVQVINHRGDAPFCEDDLAFLEALAGSVAIAIENARLIAAVRSSEQRLRVEVGALRRDLAHQDHFAEIVGTGPAMAEVFRLMEGAAPTPITVLIEGETGTGKELAARAIHRASARATGPFIAVNCASLPETLLESELFGHRRGAFTGATSDRVGLFEAADGGTVFLDEVGEMPLVMQAKLLRVLQEGEVVPLGDNRPRKVDVRVLSATNRELAGEVAAGRFRQDLYYRLATFPIRLPALRDRREDIAPIAARMLAATAARYGKQITGFTPDALAALEARRWPGNVRQLQNEIERAVALTAAGGAIGCEHLSHGTADEQEAAHPAATNRAEAGALVAGALASGGTGQAPPAHGSAGGVSSGAGPPDGGPRAGAPIEAGVPQDLRAARTAWETSFLRDALAAAGGNVTRAARAMGLSRVALQKKMKEYGLREG